MVMLDMQIPCIPPKATSQMKGACRTSSGVRFFKKANVAAAEQNLLSLVRAEMPAEWKTIEAGPVELQVLFVWPWRKSEPMRERINGAKHMDVKPDCSNIIKMLEDCLTRLNVWRDDSQVACLRVVKLWGDKPGISIRVMKIEQPKGE